jgi:hypothetical protein
MRHLFHTGWILTIALSWTGPAGAQEAADRLPLPAAGRGQFMPLHAAAVMSWLCGDTTVQLALNKSRVECYREFYPSVSVCAAALQDQAPSTRSRPAVTRLDLVNFRAVFRRCLQQNYTQRLATRGIQAPTFLTGVPDPVASQTAGLVPSR